MKRRFYIINLVEMDDVRWVYFNVNDFFCVKENFVVDKDLYLEFFNSSELNLKSSWLFFLFSTNLNFCLLEKLFTHVYDIFIIGILFHLLCKFLYDNIILLFLSILFINNYTFFLNSSDALAHYIWYFKIWCFKYNKVLFILSFR